jgi:hypothetical protein
MSSSEALWREFIARGVQEGRFRIRCRDGHAVDTQYCAIANVAPGLHVSALSPAPSLPVSLSAR